MNKISPANAATAFTLDRGIDTVVRSGGRDAMPGMSGLLELVDIAPADASPRSQLDELLALPSIAEFIDHELRPLLASELLSPQVFRAVLDESLDSLRQVGEGDPRLARTLGRAARELANRADLLDLLRMYRSALVQG